MTKSSIALNTSASSKWVFRYVASSQSNEQSTATTKTSSMPDRLDYLNRVASILDDALKVADEWDDDHDANTEERDDHRDHGSESHSSEQFQR
jgi:hypothetical protein